MNTYLDMGDHVLRIRVRRPDAEVARPKATTNAAQDFVLAFLGAGKKVSAPVRSGLTSKSFGIASNLLKKHSREDLDEFAYLFWHRYSQPIFDRPDLNAMQLFASRLDDIRREMGR